MNFDYNILLGKSKKEVLEIFGDQFNIPYAKEWTYNLKKNRLIGKILILKFNDSDIVKSFHFKYYLHI